MPNRKPSRAKARSVAKALHRKAASKIGRKPITRAGTATGSGVIRFRASNVLDSYRTSSRAAPSRKLRTSR